MSKTVFAGVDIETSSSASDASLIQIGVALGGKVFVHDVRPFKPLNLSAEALKVNGFTVERITGGAPVYEVDAMLSEWLEDNLSDRALVMPVGWNVGSFDMPFVREAFPHSMRFFHKYRSVDLNSCCFLLGDEEKWENLKKAAKRWAAEQIGRETQWHDAGYDAHASLLAFRYLQGVGAKPVAD